MKSSKGFIKVDREIMNWEWYDDAEVFKTFLHCILKANIIDKKWQGELIKRGQFVTSYANLGSELKFTVQKIRTILAKLTLSGEISIKTTNKFTVVEVINYAFFQDSNKQTTNKQQTNNKQTTTTKECKEYKNIKKYIKKDFSEKKPVIAGGGGDGLKILEEISPSTASGLKPILEDRGITLSVSKSGWSDAFENYSAPSILEAVKKATHWMADQRELKNPAVKDLVLRTSRLQKFLESYPKLDKKARRPNESMDDYVARVGINNLITN